MEELSHIMVEGRFSKRHEVDASSENHYKNWCRHEKCSNTVRSGELFE